VQPGFFVSSVTYVYILQYLTVTTSEAVPVHGAVWGVNRLITPMKMADKRYKPEVV
jgi:hypothetical protein